MEYTTFTNQNARVKEEFSVDKITNLGGASVVIDYIKDRLSLPQLLSEHLAVEKAPWSTYSMSDVAMTLICGYTLGIERISHFAEYEQDPLLTLKLGLPKLPDHTVLYKDLEKFDTQDKVDSINEVNKRILPHLVESEVILDIDSTVETLYGKQEKGEKGYNPKKHGRPSYRPALAFDGRSHACIKAWLRGGKSNMSSDFIKLYKECEAQLPAGSKIKYVRVDCEVGGEDNYAFLEEAKVGYVIKLKWNPGLQKRMKLGVLWKRLPSDEDEIIEVGSIWYRAEEWKKARRVVIIRRRPCEEPAQKVLFKDYLWEYEFIVTDRVWDEEDIWHFYNQRCSAENYIKEGKYGFFIDHIPSDDFHANYADLLLKMLAYNCYLGFQKEIVPVGYRRFTVRTMRRLFFWIPGVVVWHARQWVVKLWKGFPRKEAWWYMRARLVSLTGSMVPS